MISNDKEYIICAAIWYDDGIAEDSEEYKESVRFPMHGKGRTFTNDNIKTGFVVGQWRHGNCIALRPSNPRFNGDQYTVQGFLTSTGRFVDRWQGMYLAWMVGQVNDDTAINTKISSSWVKVGGSLDVIKMKDDSNFDINSLMNSVPSDNRHNETPFNMLYSEDLY